MESPRQRSRRGSSTVTRVPSPGAESNRNVPPMFSALKQQGRRLYELALGPLALAFLGSTDKESIAAIQALEALHGEHWVREWLALRGLDLNDYLGDCMNEQGLEAMIV